MKFGLKTIGCIGCLGILGLCALSIFIIITKPSFIWNGVVNFVNSDLVYPTVEVKAADEAEQEILEQITKVSENEVILSETQLTSIGRDRLNQFRDLTFTIEEDFLKVHWKLDDSEHPIFGELIFRVKNDNNLELVKLGTPRISLPAFAYPPMIDFIQKLAEGIKNDDELLSALKNDSNLKITKIEFEQDKVVLNVNLTINLFEND